MNKLPRRALISCCILYTAWASFTLYGEEHQEKDPKAFTETIRNLMPVAIYGKVTDQYGEAVAEADICISWTRWPLFPTDERNKTDWVKTEENGRFRFECERPYRAFVEVSKDGYESPRGSSGDLIVNRTSKDNPIVIILRKKSNPGFLIISPNIGRFPGELFRATVTNIVNRPLDLLAWNGNPHYGWKYSATTNADLRIDAVFDADNKCWNVTYSIMDGLGGVVLSDKMLYEAPADGYVPSASATFTNCYNLEKYVYLKSRSPIVYSRIMFVHNVDAGTNPSLRVSCKAWINPYGDRSLEYDDRLDNRWRVREALTAESIAAIRSKKLPSKPDIAQRIKEIEERVAREEAEKERRHKEWIERQNKQKEGKLE